MEFNDYVTVGAICFVTGMLYGYFMGKRFKQAEQYQEYAPKIKTAPKVVASDFDPETGTVKVIFSMNLTKADHD